MAKKKTTPKKVDSMRHKDKRANIPTEELRDFVAEDEKAPRPCSILCYYPDAPVRDLGISTLPVFRAQIR